MTAVVVEITFGGGGGGHDSGKDDGDSGDYGDCGCHYSDAAGGRDGVV